MFVGCETTCKMLVHYVHRFGDKNVPDHPCLKLLYISKQVFSANVSRILITMEKIKEPQARYLTQL